ncbi:MAG: hypothetical protein ACREDG_04485, partial [Methylocella sp.]
PYIVRFRHSSYGENYRRGGLDSVEDASINLQVRYTGLAYNALAGEAGAIARCLQRAFFRTPYGILDRIDPLATPGSSPGVAAMRRMLRCDFSRQ